MRRRRKIKKKQNTQTTYLRAWLTWRQIAYLLCTCCVPMFGSSFFPKHEKTYICLLECCVLVVYLLCTNCWVLFFQNHENKNVHYYYRMLRTCCGLVVYQLFFSENKKTLKCQKMGVHFETYLKNVVYQIERVVCQFVRVVYQFVRVVYQCLNPLVCWKHEQTYRFYSRMLCTCCVPIHACCVPIVESSFLLKTWKSVPCLFSNAAYLLCTNSYVLCTNLWILFFVKTWKMYRSSSRHVAYLLCTNSYVVCTNCWILFPLRKHENKRTSDASLFLQIEKCYWNRKRSHNHKREIKKRWETIGPSIKLWGVCKNASVCLWLLWVVSWNRKYQKTWKGNQGTLRNNRPINSIFGFV